MGRKLIKEHEERNLCGILDSRIKFVNKSQFVDDIVLLGVSSVIDASRFNQILDHFLYASGGEVNKGKCKYLVGIFILNLCNVFLKFWVLLEIRFWTSFKYLGTPITQKKLKSSKWEVNLKKLRQNVKMGFVVAKYTYKIYLNQVSYLIFTLAPMTFSSCSKRNYAKIGQLFKKILLEKGEN